MDTSFNDFNDFNKDDNVRAPDNTKVERLMEDTRSEYEKQIDEALYLSIQDFKQQEQIYKQYEDDILNEHVKIYSERKEQFKGFLFDLNKLIRLDKEIKEIYEIIEPIINAYCEQYIKEYELDSLTYEKIFKIIGNVRTSKNAIELLKKILIKI
jgi:hypothetical protein